MKQFFIIHGIGCLSFFCVFNILNKFILTNSNHEMEFPSSLLNVCDNNSEKAFAFWNGIALNDGLRRGDPRHTFLLDLGNRSALGGQNVHGVIVPCAAWNAWFEGKSINHIKVMSTAYPRLLGTPFDGRRR